MGYPPYVVRYSALHVTALAMLIADGFLAALAAGEGFFSAWPHFSAIEWAATVFIGVSSGIGFFLWVYALGRAPPTWLHVPVLLGPDGRKLSKSHGSVGIGALRDAGWTSDRVWEALLPALGLPPGPLHAARLDPARVPAGPLVAEADGRIRA